MADFKVVLDDLKLMANDFDQNSEVYRGLARQVSPPAADTGNGDVNAVLRSITEAFAVLHEKLATSIQNHADKLYDAHDSYQDREIDNRFLFDEIVEDL
ncbi:DUF6317 family protein [Antrihabitans cavernicola]|uniref:PE domain-containing protein n=1 Tax=Antrihabitans cavernicola TaxID=2495913 RepID=A0A5A7SIV1_9NOCA|nr:DUF6317 family protein [Spelaeibacter cavernicola]KAA0024523.1 hypothetical protein FOY51_00730 [Spelaeibacter cavernicola]